MFIFAQNTRVTMIGQKHTPQTITGKQAEIISKTLPKKNRTQKTKGRAPLPDRMTISWK